MQCAVPDIVETLRCELQDPEGDIWPDKLILDHMQQAYTHIASLRPDLFSEIKDITLARGQCLQSVCDNCSRVVEVIAIDGQDCHPPDQESSQDNLNFLNSYFESGCTDDPVDPPFTPESYTLLESSECTFRLSEPTPEDRDVTAMVSCAVEVDFCLPFEEIILPSVLCDRMYEGFRHLVLSKLYSVDMKSTTHIQLADQHFKMWQDFRDWTFRTDFASNQSDWYLYRQKTTDRSD